MKLIPIIIMLAFVLPIQVAYQNNQRADLLLQIVNLQVDINDLEEDLLTVSTEHKDTLELKEANQTNMSDAQETIEHIETNSLSISTERLQAIYDNATEKNIVYTRAVEDAEKSLANVTIQLYEHRSKFNKLKKQYNNTYGENADCLNAFDCIQRLF